MISLYEVSCQGIVKILASDGATVFCYASFKFSTGFSYIGFATRASNQIDHRLSVAGNNPFYRDRFAGMGMSEGATTISVATLRT